MGEAAGLDRLLAQHLAHLFIRDPLVIFSEMVDLDDEQSMDHFENIQSTNWQTMRFKPPPPGGQIGWRVEFRSMEVQITDFENAAFSVFIVLLTRAILSFHLNFYMPISKVDENMARAHVRDAVHTQKYFFRKDVLRARPRHHARDVSAGGRGVRSGTPRGSRASSPTRGTSAVRGTASPAHSRAPSPELGPVEDEYTEFTMNELINGKGTEFPGLIGLVYSYLDSLNIDVETRCEMALYLDLVSKRASGELMTTATWIRNFVRSHPAYKFDSVVSAEINYDMIKKLDRIERGEEDAPGFLPKNYARRRRAFGAEG